MPDGGTDGRSTVVEAARVAPALVVAAEARSVELGEVVPIKRR
jgi:hypothetical protein